jgi:hypothetical protein
MIAELMQRLQEMFKPYTFEEFVRDYNPQDIKDLENLEKSWLRYRNGTDFGPSY